MRVGIGVSIGVSVCEVVVVGEEGSFHVVVGIVGEFEQPSIEQPEMKGVGEG